MLLTCGGLDCRLQSWPRPIGDETRAAGIALVQPKETALQNIDLLTVYDLAEPENMQDLRELLETAAE